MIMAVLMAGVLVYALPASAQSRSYQGRSDNRYTGDSRYISPDRYGYELRGGLEYDENNEYDPLRQGRSEYENGYYARQPFSSENNRGNFYSRSDDRYRYQNRGYYPEDRYGYRSYDQDRSLKQGTSRHDLGNYSSPERGRSDSRYRSEERGYYPEDRYYDYGYYPQGSFEYNSGVNDRNYLKQGRSEYESGYFARQPFSEESWNSPVNRSSRTRSQQ